MQDRTIKISKDTVCCLFGDFTSKPKEEEEKEHNTELQGKVMLIYKNDDGMISYNNKLKFPW